MIADAVDAAEKSRQYRKSILLCGSRAKASNRFKVKRKQKSVLEQLWGLVWQ